MLFASGCAWDTQTTFLKAAALVGKATPDLISVRKTPVNPLAEQLNLYSSGGPRPSDRTRQTLRRYALAEKYDQDPDAAAKKMLEQIEKTPTAELTIAYAELMYIAGLEHADNGDKDHALDMYAEAVVHSYMFLFEPKYDELRNPYDPQFRRACDLYNESLEEALRILNLQGKLQPGVTHTVQTARYKFDVDVQVRGPWQAGDFQRFEFASDYEVASLTNHYHTYGLGVPLIAVRKKRGEGDRTEKYYPPNLTFPVTAFLRVDSNRPPAAPGDSSATGQVAAAGARHCTLELCDPLYATDVLVSDRRAPLESDFSTPLAYYLNDPLVRSNVLATFALLDADFGKQFQGLYMLEPFDPRKIPVVMVHGLWSSPVTWTDMFNDLQATPDLNRNYQFWFYLYPTGQPFWISAAQMRSDLDQARRDLDPERRSAAFDQMVLVGHSMGGLVSKLQTIASGDRFWEIVSDRPFGELKADDETRARLENVFFFEPNRSVRRVITLGTPHRGSHFANPTTRLLGRTLFMLPTMLVQTSQKVTADNPGMFRETEMLNITTSIDSLAPDSPIFPVMLQSTPAPWVTYHNVIGRVDNKDLLGRISPDSDGVVPVASARVENAATELEVAADHTHVHSHPEAILEVRKILEEHLRLLRTDPDYVTKAWRETENVAQRPEEAVAPVGSVQ